MRAVLHTRCGCSQTINIAGDAGHGMEIKVPLTRRYTAGQTDLPNVTFDVRVFQFTGQIDRVHPTDRHMDVAHFLEKE